MSEHRIVDPAIARDLALREARDRRRAEYAMGSILGGAALGDPVYERMAGCIAYHISEYRPELMRPEAWRAKVAVTK